MAAAPFDWSNIIIQLGIAALIVVVSYQLARLLIEKWSEGDKERTAAQKSAMDSLSTSINNLAASFKADLRDCTSSVTALGNQTNTTINALGQQLTRIDTNLEFVLELTPVKNMMASHEIPYKAKPKVIVSPDLQSDHDDTPPMGTRKTPAQGQPYGPITRPKTERPR